MIVNKSTSALRSLEIYKRNIPRTDDININVTVVEYSTPEELTVNHATTNLGEDLLQLKLVENALFIYGIGFIELNIFMSKGNNMTNNYKERNSCKCTENNGKH